MIWPVLTPSDPDAMSIPLQAPTVLECILDGTATQVLPRVVFPLMNAAGGMLNAFYRTFNYADNTTVNVMVSNIGNSPWCSNPNMAPDNDFRTGSRPPSFAGDGDGNGNALNANGNVTVHEYRTAANRTVRSLSGPVEIGSEIFVPNADWENNPKVKDMLQLFRRQDDDDDCTSGSALLQEAASKLDAEELGESDTIVERV
ncbi:hypothetical protein VNI00_013195 [Paramarasmius palmivorus]|uniref:Uncharacterized protein n=1 Tax=Paramarasmius palmivorus TaxID=297713 RepID=A0AAW0B4D1_9AGAR